MPWTTTPPSVPGWYWNVGPHDAAPNELESSWEAVPKVVVVARDGEGEMVVLRLGESEDLPLSAFRGRWLGPLEVPKAPRS